jgi:hypothetical protein
MATKRAAKAPATEYHVYTLSVRVATLKPLTDARLCALAKAMALPLSNSGYALHVTDCELPIAVVDHATRPLGEDQ